MTLGQFLRRLRFRSRRDELEQNPSLDNLVQDLRFGLRMLAKTPGFTALAVLTLALGIGANTAVFSLVDAVLLRPLPFPHAERLMAVRLTPAKADQFGAFGNADFIAWRDQQKSFSSVAAWAGGQGEFSFRAGGEPQRVRGVAVTAGFFETLGIQPELGRSFHPSDDRPEAAPVVMVSHEFWKLQLGGDSEIAGKTINLNGQPYTVAGVMHSGVRFPSDAAVDVWPLRRIPAPRARPPYYLAAFGRLRLDVSPQQAAQELSLIAKGVEQQYPTSSAWVGRVEPIKERMTSSVRGALWIILAAVTFVLLIAIANVANLLLARATARQREIAVRLALGATRQRILLQLVTESVLLSSIGGGVGVVLAYWAQRAFLSAGNVAHIPLAYQVEIDGRMLLFTLAVSVVAGVIFGLAPALRCTGPLAPALKEAERGSGDTSGQTVRRVLVAGEFAIALVLLVGAALLIRSFVRLYDVDPGFNVDHLVTAQVTLPSALYRDDKAIVRFWDEFLQRMNAVPGVQSASLTMALPPNLLALTNPFTVEGQPYDKSRQLQLAEEATVAPGYFATLHVPILGGRDFNAGDAASKQDPVIINRTTAEKYFRGQDPIGHKLQTGDPDPNPPTETIIGVVGDVKYSGLDAEPVPQLYKLYSAQGWSWFSRTLFLVIRTDSEPGAVMAGVRNQLALMDGNLPLADAATMRERLGDSLGEQRFRTLLIGSLASLALLLACFGIYAVMSYSVAQRTREIGIRAALGATAGELFRLVLRQALLVCGAGLATGTVAALALTRALRTLLFGVTPADPLSFGFTIALLLLVAILASYVPARRATKVDPMVALRYE